MKRHHWAAIPLLVTAGLGSTAFAQAPALHDGPGWTGITAPQEVIAARRTLMVELQRLMVPVDSFTAGEPADQARLQSAARTISTLLQAAPHLFPPTTNSYDAALAEPSTNALPAVWLDFATFAELTKAAAATADRMASTAGEEPLRSAGRGVRAGCDGCHALYLREYVPAAVTDEDLEFDFDSFLPQN
jgi:cytochrome c556